MHHQPYIPRSGGKATVVWVSGEHTHVQFDAATSGEKGGDSTHYSVDPKQCRKLKKRRRVWLSPYAQKKIFSGIAHTHMSTKKGGDDWLEFIEVKRK
jgi:hypothetical protein